MKGAAMLKNVITELQSHGDRLRKLIHQLDSSLSSAPSGRIHTTVTHGSYQYYLEIQGKRRYLSIKERPLAAAIAERDYKEKMKQTCQRQLTAVEAFLRVFQPDAAGSCYDELPEARKALVKPIIDTDEQFINRWKDVAKTRYEIYANPYPVPNQFATERGELVRSKSELILANEFHRQGVPYFYELALPLADGSAIFPDFTLLDVPNRRVVYWEHFGLMDDFGYTARIVTRIALYEKMNLRPGKELLFTMESRDCPLNVKTVRKMIQEM